MCSLICLNADVNAKASISDFHLFWLNEEVLTLCHVFFLMGLLAKLPLGGVEELFFSVFFSVLIEFK